MGGSIREVRYFISSRAGYEKIRGMVAGKSWEIVGFGLNYLIIRIERENIKFDRSKGNILERFKI